MIFNRKSKEEKEAEKIREEQEKLLKKQQKEEEEQCNKELGLQQKEQKEIEKQNRDLDIAKLGPVPITKDEQSLYRYNIEQGTFRKKIIASYFVTNYRIMTIIGRENNPQIALENISDVVAINTHRAYEGGYRGYTVGTRGYRYHVGGQRGKSISYGDLVISSPVTEDQIWRNIHDYNSLIRLIKSLRKTRIEQLKKMEKMK